MGVLLTMNLTNRTVASHLACLMSVGLNQVRPPTPPNSMVPSEDVQEAPSENSLDCRPLSLK